jgi:hypothetical protein
MGKRIRKTKSDTQKTEKLAAYAKKRQTKLFKLERLMAELDCIKREVKAQKESLAADDNYLLRILGE